VYKPAYSIEIQVSMTVITKGCIILQSTLINQVYSLHFVDCIVCKQYEFTNSVPQTCVSLMMVNN